MADEFIPFGFIQPTYVDNLGGTVDFIPQTATSPINGATLPVPNPIRLYNGQRPLFNLVGPDLENSNKIRFLRARLGMKGFIPNTDERINYFLLVAAGDNGLTYGNDVVVSDAFLTFNYFPGGRVAYLPGARIRLGLGRLPLGEEAMQGYRNIDYINFTAVTDQLLHERFFEEVSASAGRTLLPAVGAPFGYASLRGGFSGFRDLGIQMYDWYNLGLWEYAYAIMVTQANGVEWNQNRNSGNNDVIGRLQLAYVFEGVGPDRKDVMGYIWRQSGDRQFGTQDYERIREGVGFRYRKNALRFSGEYIRGRGMILYGYTPPFNDLGAPGFEPALRVGLGTENEAAGSYLETEWRFKHKWEVGLRYDTLRKLTNSDFDAVKSITWTLGLQHFYSDTLRLTFNYENRRLRAVNPMARSSNPQVLQGAVSDVIRSAIGNRVSLQGTWHF